jgi:hypothetical protein
MYVYKLYKRRERVCRQYKHKSTRIDTPIEQDNIDLTRLIFEK